MTGSGLFGGNTPDTRPAGNPRGLHMLTADVHQGDELRRKAIRNSYDSRSRCLTPHPRRFLPALSLFSLAGRPLSPTAGSRIVTSTVDKPLPRRNGASHSRVIGRRSQQNHLERLHSSFSAASASRTRELPPVSTLHRRGSFSESNIAARCRNASEGPIPTTPTEDVDASRSLTPAPPCSTTTLDFHRHPLTALRAAGSGAVSVLQRCATPRGNNPHPVGLVFQSPYNRHGKVRRVRTHYICNSMCQGLVISILRSLIACLIK